MFCTGCGKEIPDGSKFCIHCGKQLPATEYVPSDTVTVIVNEGEEEEDKAFDKKRLVMIAMAILIIVLLAIFLLRGCGGQSLKVGSIIKFGHYEQDNNLQNGKEPIEWEVLAENNGSYLLISRYILDNQPYNDLYTDSNGNYSGGSAWEDSYLYDWLNTNFYSESFNKKEMKRIDSKVSLFDLNEAVYYLGGEYVGEYPHSAAYRSAGFACEPTDYAIALGVNYSTIDEMLDNNPDYYGDAAEQMKKDGKKRMGLWRLRELSHYNDSTGLPTNSTLGVRGITAGSEGFVMDMPIGVRPIMWIH